MKLKILIVLASIFLSTQAMAGRDSVAFFYSTKKVNILMNERASAGRIQQFMDLFNADNELVLINAEQDVKVGCARELDRATCTFTFYPGNNVEFATREIFFKQDLKEFGVAANGDFEMIFESSMKDKIKLIIEDNVLYITGSKK